MFETIKGGNPIPPKVWLRATDVAAEFARCGEAFVAAGRPATGNIAAEYAKAEAAYNQMADAIWFAKWTPSQREEWRLLFGGEATDA